MGWEFRRRHLWALIAMAGYLLALAAIKLLFLGPMEPIRLDPPDGRAAVVITPLTATYFYLLAAFSFGLAGDLGARPSIYPARMFALPLRTAASSRRIFSIRSRAVSTWARRVAASIPMYRPGYFRILSGPRCSRATAPIRFPFWKWW